MNRQNLSFATASRGLFWQSAGFLTLLAAYAVAAALPLSSFPLDLFLSGAIGFYLCSLWQLKGCSYALILLALVGIAGHVFLESHHFLRLGLEASFACSFFVAALSFETDAEGLSSLQSQFGSQVAAIQNLEEEIGKARESHVDLQISFSKKIEDLQKNCEEISAEKSSLEILNDVLRIANAAHFDEKKAMENQSLDDERHLASVQYNLEQLQNELSRLQKIDLENESLLLKNDKREIEDLKTDRADILGRLAAAEQKIHDLAKFEALYKQLKAQFEEKGRVLHEARCALFKTETDLQTLTLEKEEQNSFFPEQLRVELDRLDKEIAELQGENLELQDLVTHLTERLPQPASFAMHRIPLPAGQLSLEETLREALIPKRKKKAKKPAQQDLLF